MPSHTAKERAKKSKVRAKALPAKANKRAVLARKTAFAKKPSAVKKPSAAAKVVKRRARNKRRGR